MSHFRKCDKFLMQITNHYVDTIDETCRTACCVWCRARRVCSTAGTFNPSWPGYVAGRWLVRDDKGGTGGVQQNLCSKFCFKSK